MGSGLAVGVVWLAVAATAACSTSTPRSEEGGSSSPLIATTQVETAGEVVRFVLQVTNASESAVELEFRSGQSFDFVVTQEGREVWRWSADKMFTMALREETIAPGETLTYSAEWPPPQGASGRYQVRGILTAQEHRLEQAAEFTLE